MKELNPVPDPELTPEQFSREFELFPAIREAHRKLELAQIRDVKLASGDVDSSRRYAFWSDDRSSVPVDHHMRFTLTPEARIKEIADIAQIVLRIPMAQHAFADSETPSILPPAKFVPTYDVVGHAINSQGLGIRFLLNPSGLFAYNTVDDLDRAPEEEFVFSGQYLRVKEGDDRTMTQVELEEGWFDVVELESMLEFYDPIPQDNLGPSASNVA